MVASTISLIHIVGLFSLFYLIYYGIFFYFTIKYFLNLRLRISIYYKIIRIPINIIRVVRIKKETSRPEVFKTCVINLKTRALDVFNARVKSNISRSWSTILYLRNRGPQIHETELSITKNTLHWSNKINS